MRILNSKAGGSPSLTRAFSLVELSIVLVILGLLVGGVLSGRALIHASELRSITTERDKFAAAIFTFREKYFQLPGDLSNAYQFWGAGCGTDTTTPSTGCNGNGDGFLASDDGEQVKAWEHMTRAGLISGNYDGMGVVVLSSVQLNTTNIPASKFPKLYWSVNRDVSTSVLAAGNVGGNPYLALQVGPVAAANHSVLPFPSSPLTREDAWGVDNKTDDGKARSGKVRGFQAMFPNTCTDNGADYYRLSAGPTIGDCWLFFILQ